MKEQTSFLNEEPVADSCCTCNHFSELKEPRSSEEGWTIYGYCFKDGIKVHNTNMGKGYPVYISNAKCKEWKKLKHNSPIIGY